MKLVLLINGSADSRARFAESSINRHHIEVFVLPGSFTRLQRD